MDRRFFLKNIFVLYLNSLVFSSHVFDYLKIILDKVQQYHQFIIIDLKSNDWFGNVKFFYHNDNFIFSLNPLKIRPCLYCSFNLNNIFIYILLLQMQRVLTVFHPINIISFCILPLVYSLNFFFYFLVFWSLSFTYFKV